MPAWFTSQERRMWGWPKEGLSSGLSKGMGWGIANAVARV